jgi:hypothetical protein
MAKRSANERAPNRGGSSSENAADEPIDPNGIIIRPAATLRDLPLEFRWEVTRRHPYYLTSWPYAKRHYEAPSSDWSAPRILIHVL